MTLGYGASEKVMAGTKEEGGLLPVCEGSRPDSPGVQPCVQRRRGREA